MIINSSLELVSWVLIIFKAPGLGGVDRAGRRISLVCMSRFVGSRLVVVGWSVMVCRGRVVGWCMVRTVGTICDSGLGTMADADMGSYISRGHGHNDQRHQ